MSYLLFKHVRVLTFWSLPQIFIGIPFIFLSSGLLWYFFLMNWCWGLINLIVAFWMYLHIGNEQFRNKPLEYRPIVYLHVRKMLALNIGFDVAYILIGLVFFWVSTTTFINHPDLWVGFSLSLFIQGAYLLIHDSLFLKAHQRAFRRWLKKWKNEHYFSG